MQHPPNPAAQRPQLPLPSQPGRMPLPPAFEGLTLDAPLDKLRTKTCRHWERGRCFWGNSCRFLHAATPPVDTNTRNGNSRRQGVPERAPRAPQPTNTPHTMPHPPRSSETPQKDSPTLLERLPNHPSNDPRHTMPLSALSVRVGPRTVSPGVSMTSFPASEPSTPGMLGEGQPPSQNVSPQKSTMPLPSPGNSGTSSHPANGGQHPGRTYSHNPYGSSPIHSPGISSATSTPFARGNSFSGSTTLTGMLMPEFYRNGGAAPSAGTPAPPLPSAYAGFAASSERSRR